VKEPFFTTKAKKRDGPCLAICNRILEEHHGSFGLTSEPGKGTTVRICLPRGS
jgi:signal transduction histidine kinase